VTPNVTLRLRTLGWREPPFLLKAAGDLVYKGYSFVGDTREIHAITVESGSSEKTPPVVTTDLRFLRISPAAMTERPDSDPNVVQRTYRYRVTFSCPPPRAFSGEVRVVDPWEPGATQRIYVQGDVLPALQVSPSRIVFGGTSSADRSVLSARLLVRSRFPVPQISAVAEPNSAREIAVTRDRLEQDSCGAQFTIQVRRPDGPQGREFKIVIRPEPDSREQVVVPVLVQDGRLQ
jgi:hypothetical protein